MGKRISHLVGIFALLIFLVTGAIIIAIWAVPMYEVFIRLLHLNDTVGLSVHDVVKNYVILLQYLNFPWVKRLNLPDFPVSESGAFHFYEVKKWFMVCYILFILGLLIGGSYLKKLKKSQESWRLVRPFQFLSLLIIILILILVFGDFDAIFTAFHHVLFRNSAWLFDPRTDPIILVLPESFFFACFVLVFIVVELGCWLLQRYGKRSLYHA